MDAESGEASLRDALGAALEANRRLAETASGLGEENARLREEIARLVERDAQREAELERPRTDLAVLQRMVFGRSSERSRPEPAAGEGGDDEGGRKRRDGSGGSEKNKRGPGARAGRRDYSHLPRFKVVWDFPGGGYCCPECGEPFTALGDHWSGEQVDWRVIVRVVAHCRRRYRRACPCRGPVTVMAPGPPEAIGESLFTNGFIAMLLTERYVAGRSQNSLVTGLARSGADISPATLAGTCTAAGALLAPLEKAITERSRGSWHLHADETDAFFAEAFARLRSAAPGLEGIAGCPFLVFYGEVSDDSDGPLELCRPVAAGSAVDVTFRMVMDRLGAQLGQQIVPVAQPGASGAIAAHAAAGQGVEAVGRRPRPAHDQDLAVAEDRRADREIRPRWISARSLVVAHSSSRKFG